jgi:WD40 repeat protein
MFWNKSVGKMGKISGSSKWDPMLSIVCWNDKFVSGGQSGSIYLWSGGSGTPTKGHEGRVDCLSVDSKNNLYSGCSKGMIIAWKVSGGKLIQDRKVMDVSKFDKIDSGVLSLDFNNDKILIGTNSSSIFEV